MSKLLPTRIPKPFDAEAGARAQVPGADIAQASLISGAAGCSPYLAELIRKEATWLGPALSAPRAAVTQEITALAEVPPDQLSAALRQAKRRIALMVALADLGGAWSLQDVTGTLTALADAACDAALRAALGGLAARGKLPGFGPDDLEDCAGMVVLAMGKMGAHELNYSSDIDLICLFDETRFDASDFAEARASMIRATRTMTAMLSEITDLGYVFRTDLRLRPDPSVTPVCVGMEAAERYYERQGRTWERAALIKARPCAGDLAGGQAFLARLAPFIWRRHLDFAAIEDAHDMRLAIRTHKGTGGPITLPGHDMKLGRGGIREIEFYTQTRQLIAGGRDESLRQRGTLAGLTQLARKGWTTLDLANTLSDHYQTHRAIEHRLQMVRDAQTHALPKTDEGFARLAAMMDTDPDTLKVDLRARLEAVHEGTEGFFTPPAAQSSAPPIDEDITAAWPRYPALRSARSAAVFERIRPMLMARLGQAAQPVEALRAFDGFLAGLPAGVQLFSLFQANPHLMELAVDIVSISPRLADYLARNASVFDAVIAGDFFGPWPGAAALEQALTDRLAAESDYESQLDTARRWVKEWHFRVGVHFLRGLITAEDAATHYAELASACLRALWPLVQSHFAKRHGPPPGDGAVILGMGSLGTGNLTAASDLDLIVIYEAGGQEASLGAKPLPSRTYYARLTQALITALSAAMAQGRLYEVDMRLRPSGNSGPVATSFAAFETYQQEEAWLWEHLALTRARVIAGPEPLAAQVEDLRKRIIAQPRSALTVRSDLAAMRARIQAAKGPAGPWEAKLGYGRMQEIELVAQAGLLLTHDPRRDVAPGLENCVAAGLLDAANVGDCLRAYKILFDMQMVARLISSSGLNPDGLGVAGSAFLLRVLGAEHMDQLAERLDSLIQAAGQSVDAALGADE